MMLIYNMEGGKNAFFQVVTLQAERAVAVRSASRCRRVQTSVNMSQNFSGHLDTNVTARQPAARLPGPAELDRNGQEYAHLHPATLLITCQRLVLFPKHSDPPEAHCYCFCHTELGCHHN